MPIRMAGLASGLDTDSIVKELMSAQRMKATKIQNKITKMEWTGEKWSGLNTKLYSFYTGALSKIKMQGNFGTKKVSSSNTDKVEVTASSNAPTGIHTVQVNAVANAQFLTGAKFVSTVDGHEVEGKDKNGNEITNATLLTNLGFDVSQNTTISVQKVGETDPDKIIALKIGNGTTVSDFLTTLNKAGLNASYDTVQKRFFISSKESGTENAFTIKATNNPDPENPSPNSPNSLALLGLCDLTADDNGVVSKSGENSADVNLITSKDAKIVYNGVELTSSSNTITANGLTFTVKKETAVGETVSLNISNDTQAVYDMVKDFVKSYNSVLKEMNTAYDADPARGYEPLTDEQKDSMSDKEVEKWENKIKDSLLRRDTVLGSLTSTMKSDISGGYEVDGKKYAASSFGIEAADYSEEGLLHIDGDKDDIIVAGKENKLMKALTDDPDKVMGVLTQMGDKLYSDFTEKMKSTNYNSALTLYNDKLLAKNIKDSKNDLSDMNKKLTDMEDRYYRQFSVFEATMQRLNSQTQSLSQMLGTKS
jgi:flagellar hook-associated protein 2